MEEEDHNGKVPSGQEWHRAALSAKAWSDTGQA